MLEILGEAVRHFTHQRRERDGSGLEFAHWGQQLGVEGTVLLPNEVGHSFERIG
ncbi:hypothetical protein TM233_48300 [Bradyrhizobium sp. TM233]|nr:hypothetical protein TM233_48300 [Bradyrhizobium sp. TM233]